MTRRRVAWLLTLPLAVAGSQAAHALAYQLAEPSAHERAHLLSEAGHGYLRFTAAGLGIVAAVVLFALVLEIRAMGSGAGPVRTRLWPFAALVLSTFVFQEHFERLFHDGSFPWGAALETTFLLGAALQLPFALLGYLVARLLLGAARLVAVLLAQPPYVYRCSRPQRPSAPVVAPRAASTAFTLGPRGPPSLRSA